MIAVLIISIFFQLIAVFFAFRLILITKKYLSWGLIAAAISLMAIRRIISLISILSGSAIVVGATSAEYVALLISILLSAGIILVLPLISSIKKNEVDLEISNKILTQNNLKIEHMLFELEKAKSKAEESDKLKSAFLANLSHEIRTPMNGIIGFIDLLSNPDLDQDSKEKYYKVIKQSGNYLLSIINDIVEISKIETHQVNPNYKEVDLVVLVNEIYDATRIQLLEKKEIRLTLDKRIPDIEFIIETDRTKLSQILNNLVSNAIKFTSKGKITIGYSLVNNHTFEFFVEDTGIGIQHEDLKFIFERFYQINSDQSPNNRGSGLGLAISKAYVEMLGGQIYAESKPGEGSTFTFTIPIHKRDIPMANTENDAGLQPRLPDSNSIVILVAEDDDINYFLISEIFKKTPFHLIRAKTGKEAVEACDSHRINLVLMDLKMPVMDGYEATKILKERFPDLPVIAVTAYALSGDYSKIQNSGFDGYIPKPINHKALFEIIEKKISLSREIINNSN